jgi:hypothetical protein
MFPSATFAEKQLFSQRPQKWIGCGQAGQGRPLGFVILATFHQEINVHLNGLEAVQMVHTATLDLLMYDGVKRVSWPSQS